MTIVNTTDKKVNIELERTPEAVAVSAVNRVRPGVDFTKVASGQLMPVNHSGTAGINLVPGGVVVAPAPGTEYCGRYAVLAVDKPELHAFRKRIVCSKEWCVNCGKDHSDAHQRRKATWTDKVQRVSSLGYYVIQFPVAERDAFLNGTTDDIRAKLRAIRGIVAKTLRGKRQRDGSYSGRYQRLMGRWHWFGESCVNVKGITCQLSGKQCPKSHAESCDYFVNNGAFNPHLNILVDDGFIEPDTFETIKAALRTSLHSPNLIVHYDYFVEPKLMLHKVAYITRATFKEYKWSPKLAHSLWHFTNAFSYGNFKGEKVWQLDTAEHETANIIALQSGICPICGESLKVCGETTTGEPSYWSLPIPSAVLAAYPARELGGGFAVLDVPQMPADIGFTWLEKITLTVLKLRHDATVERQNKEYRERLSAALLNLQGGMMPEVHKEDWLDTVLENNDGLLPARGWNCVGS